MASRCPELLEGAWLPNVTYPTQKHRCILSFRTPHHREALLVSYSRAVLLQVSLLPEHSQPHCVACALEAFTRDSAGQQFDRAPARYQDLKQRQHLHGTSSMLLPTSGITNPLQQGISTMLISCVYVQTLMILAIAMTPGQRQWHGGGAPPQAVELNTLP